MLGEPTATVVALPTPVVQSATSLEAALSARRSLRAFSSEALTLQQAAQLLWAAQGVIAERGRRTVPSAGALYPLEVYLVAGDVQGVAAGVYRYRPETHDLVLSAPGDRRDALAEAALAQPFVRHAPASLIICAVYERTGKRYGLRGAQYVHVEVGHAGQNVYLQCVSLGLGTVAVGAFDDRAVATALRLSEEEQPLYIMPVGKR